MTCESDQCELCPTEVRRKCKSQVISCDNQHKKQSIDCKNVKTKEEIKASDRKRHRKRRLIALSSGLCPNCYKREPETGYKTCSECKLNKNKYKKKLKKEGRCPGCGRPMTGQETVYCTLCGKGGRLEGYKWS